MPARPIGPDQPQGADGIARGLLNIRRRQFNACGLGLRLDLGAQRAFDLLPVAVERGRQLVARGLWPIRTSPRGSARLARNICTIVLQALEKSLPLRIDGIGVGLVARVEVLDVGGVSAIEK